MPCSTCDVSPFSGDVVQLVRTLPCHGRGREFESRRPRHSFQGVAGSDAGDSNPQLNPQLLSLSYALRGLDPSQSRGASRRASSIAPAVRACERARFHQVVSFFQRLDDQTIDHHAVGETVRRLCGSLRQKPKWAPVGADTADLAQRAVSTFFVQRMHPHGQKPLPWHYWLK